MNYYERIQQSIDFIESHIEDKIIIKDVAQRAYMSHSNFYRLFFALVGHSVKDYIRLRRISLASKDLKMSSVSILSIAVKYDFSSSDAFSRAFKKITATLPSDYRNGDCQFSFERINLMEKYYEIQDKDLLERYPDIKILKELEPIRVAYYCYYGKDPETHAFDAINQWLKTIDPAVFNNARIYGYNNPSPTSEEQQEYGYEVCVTIDDDYVVNDARIKTKVLDGGKFVVASVPGKKGEDFGNEIQKSWHRLHRWLEESNYSYGGQQWLEEHLGFDHNFNHIGGIDLYMPIVPSVNSEMITHFLNVEPIKTITYTAYGPNAIEEGRAYFFNFLQENGLSNIEDHQLFAYYNFEQFGQKDFFYKIHLSMDVDMPLADENINYETFSGGSYAVRESLYSRNGIAWQQFISWIEHSTDYSYSHAQFFEVYHCKQPIITASTPMTLYMPAVKKLNLSFYPYEQ